VRGGVNEAVCYLRPRPKTNITGTSTEIGDSNALTGIRQRERESGGRKKRGREWRSIRRDVSCLSRSNATRQTD